MTTQITRSQKDEIGKFITTKYGQFKGTSPAPKPYNINSSFLGIEGTSLKFPVDQMVIPFVVNRQVTAKSPLKTTSHNEKLLSLKRWHENLMDKSVPKQHFEHIIS